MNKKLVQLAISFRENQKISICEKDYIIQGMNMLNTTDSLNTYYFKAELSGHVALLIDPFEDVIMIGKKIKDISEGTTFPNKFIFKKNEFVKECEGYQMVRKQMFGPLFIEGECAFANYTCEKLPNVCISPGYIFRTQKREDYFLETISYNDIKLK